MEQLTQETSDHEEEWKVIINTGGNYTLSGIQAQILMQAMAQKRREVIFKTFVIAIPYIAEFYRVKRFLKGSKQLPSTASEKPYVPISDEKFEKIKKEAYAKIGKNIK